MGGRLSSPRFRRRLAWATGVTVVLTVVVGGAILIGDTGKKSEAPLTSGRPWVYYEPKAHRLTARERTELVHTTATFIQEAVARRDLDHAWTMLGPELRAGMTRKEWDTGNNTVVPFPAAGITALDVLYSYEDDVALDVSLISKPPYDTIGKTFTIEFKRSPHSARWLVASWVPRGVSSPAASRSASKEPPLGVSRAALSAKWLLVPLSILALIVLVPLVLAVRSVIASRRATRRYAQELARYRSTSSPS